MSPASQHAFTLVALHGNGGGAFRFARMRPYLPPGVDFPEVTLPGFSGLPDDEPLPGLLAYVDHVAAMLATARPPVILLGHGIGGSIALQTVQHYAPLVNGLILHAPVGADLDRRWFPRLMNPRWMRRMAQRVMSDRRLRPLWRRLLFRQAVPAEYLDEFFESYRRCAAFSRAFDWITPAWFRSLQPVDIPAVLLWGEQERVLRVDQVHSFRRLLPRATVRQVRGWDHFPMIDEPAAYTAEVVRLAESLVDSLAAQPR